MSQWQGYGPDNVLRTDVGVGDTTSSPNPRSGILTYEPDYGLQSKPFSLSTDPRTLYKSSSHAAVFEDLLAAIRRREGLIVLTGEMGTGKTTLCRAALYQLDRKTFTTFVPDPSLSREDLLRMLLVGFGEVSTYDLKQGRLKETPRAELAWQLYDFLISLESVDAFAALVIDEAQNLSGPLLDEIRALSEMEAGRRLLQIVLVGQPELRTRLKLPEMQQIAQRVTTACELKPLTREGVDGYVSHRLAVAGGTRDRVEFSSAALDVVFAASSGVPRLVNRICDRALFHGHLERASQVGLSQATRAIQELELSLPLLEQPVAAQAAVATAVKTVATPLETVVATAPTVAAATATTTLGGLFVKTTNDDTLSSEIDLKALLDLPAVARQPAESMTSSRVEGVTMSHRPTRQRAWWKRALRALSVPALGMTVMLLAGGVAVSTVGGTVKAEPPPLPARPLMFPSLLFRAVPAPMEPANTVSEPPANSSAGASEQTWVVQVAAFATPSRSVAMVQRLTDGGWPAYQVEPDSTQGLTLVRIGPFRSAGEAADARTRLRETPDYEGAFVRNITK